MKEVKIRIHSFIDVITNSSTEIYVRADESTVGAVKELVDVLLAAAGSDKKADDLFDFKLVRDVEDEEADEYDYYDIQLLVTAKDGLHESVRAAQILSNLSGLFSVEAEYNG